MAKDHREAMRVLSRRLAARSESVLEHPTAKGDAREQLLRGELKRMVGSAFAVEKAEVVDSTGRSSGEIDVVVYDQRAGACVHRDEAGRAVVRVENVALTVEVKSRLESKHLEALFQDDDGLMQLRRFFKPRELLQFTLQLPTTSAEEVRRAKAAFNEGLGAWAHLDRIPAIPRFVFALDGIRAETAADHVWCPHVDVVCVLGKYTLAKERVGFSPNPTGVEVWAADGTNGDDALGAFFHLIEQALECHLGARDWVAPKWHRYFWSPEVRRRED